MNFISNDANSKEMIKNSNYDTIGKDKKNNSDKSNQPHIMNIKGNMEETNNSDSLSHYIEKETNERQQKLIRFAVDYCRASPNISLKSKSILNIGWRTQKFNYDVEYEMMDYKMEIQTIHSIMTAIPINKSYLKFEDDFVRESYNKVLQNLTQNHKNLHNYLHFDILHSQKIMIKIQKLMELGSLRDIIYKTNPINSYNKKYPHNKMKGLHLSLISQYGRQILEALQYLHQNNWYHMHLHSGNILIEEESNLIKLTELENFVNDLNIRNEHFFNYAYENLNNNIFDKNDYNSNILSEIFKNNFNIFEKIDIISFGRVLYEMTTGRELKAPYPDLIEYKEMDKEIVEVLKLIFNKKISHVNNNCMMTVPDVSVNDLLKLRIFKNEDEYNQSKILFLFLDDTEILYNNDQNIFFGDYDTYCSFIKENIFNQQKYLKNKLKTINNLY